jgi:osmotically-inducible protein OsmY
MRTDAQIQLDVIDELRWDPKISEKEIGVAVKDGVVTLSGFVPSYAERFAAEIATERVSGVRAVATELAVKLAAERTRSDTEIAHKAVDALKWDVMVPDEQIKLRVVDGWVTLEGETEWQYQKEAAARSVRYLIGVRGLTNAIVVKSKVSPFEVSTAIKNALRRSAELDAEKVQVAAKDGTVTLRGKVRSWAERQDVERAAWSAPGVTDVVDELTIAL